MYTWAAHGMDHCGKVIVVNPADLRGPEILGWQVAPSIMDALAAARQWLANSEATVSYLRCPPVTYLKVGACEWNKMPCDRMIVYSGFSLKRLCLLQVNQND